MSNNSRRGVLPLPGVASSYRADVEHAESWRVTTTSDPATSTSDAVSRTMSISDIDDDISRVYRARELVRARVTMNTQEQLDYLSDFEDVDPRILQAVDAYRVNTITKQLGYDTDVFSQVMDYKKLGNRYATLGDIKAWNSLLADAIPLLETKAFNQMVTGVRQVRPEWAAELRSISNAVKYGGGLGLSEWSPESLGDTTPTEFNANDSNGRERPPIALPKGYRYVINRARNFTQYVKYEPKPADRASLPGLPDLPSDEFGKFFGTGEDGTYAELVLDRSVTLTKTVKGYLHRKKKSSYFGKRVLYPSRMLTDPNKQIFGHKTKAPGGIVVVDVSGSMSLSIEDVESILDAAPGAVVMAYSHGASRTNHPNCTILAYRGKQVQKIPSKIFRGGNGVDGPALEYAVKLRRSGEPIVWVSDGEVTTATDGQTREIVEMTADYVVKHKIVQIPSTPKAVEAFRTRRLVSEYDGAVGNRIKRKYGLR